MDKPGVATSTQPGWLAAAVDAILQRDPEAQGKRSPAQTVMRLRSAPLSQLHELALRAFTEAMPKIDLHRHLNGAVPIERLLATAGQLGIGIPAKEVERLRPRSHGSAPKTLVEYLRKFDVICKVLQSPSVIEDFAAACIGDAAQDNLVHVEVRFSPQYMATAHALDAQAIIEAVARGVGRGVAETGISARLIVIIARHASVEEGARVARIAAQRQDLGIAGLDLAGPEAEFPPGPFAAVFREAKRDGLCITAHGGEGAGAASVKAATLELEADRIGHAVRAAEDLQVVELLKSRGVFTEACPTANVQVGAVVDYPQHPVASFLRAGLKQTVNTDNPALSGVTLSQELQRVIATFDLTLTEVRQLTQNAIDGAFLPPQERTALGTLVATRLAAAERQLAVDLAT